MSHPAASDLGIATSSLRMALHALRMARARGEWSPLHAAEVEAAMRELETRIEPIGSLLWLARGIREDQAL